MPIEDLDNKRLKLDNLRNTIQAYDLTNLNELNEAMYLFNNHYVRLHKEIKRLTTDSKRVVTMERYILELRNMLISASEAIEGVGVYQQKSPTQDCQESEPEKMDEATASIYEVINNSEIKKKEELPTLASGPLIFNRLLDKEKNDNAVDENMSEPVNGSMLFNKLLEKEKAQKESSLSQLDSNVSHQKEHHTIDKNMIACVAFQMQRLVHNYGLYLQSDEKESLISFDLRIKIIDALKYYLQSNPSIEELYEYINELFNYKYLEDEDSYGVSHLFEVDSEPLEVKIVKNFISITKRISSGLIYSSLYSRISFNEVPYNSKYRLEYDELRKLLDSTYYYFSSKTDCFALSPVSRGKYAYYNAYNSHDPLYNNWKVKIENIKTDFTRDLLYKEVENEISNIVKEIENLYTHINKTISELELVDLYELLSHKHEENFTQNCIFDSDFYNSLNLSKFKQLFFKHIEDRSKYELSIRVERSALANIARDVYFDFLESPSFEMQCDVETHRKILWAWNFIMLNKPSDLDIENKQEQWACLHLVDVLPSLANYYRNRYSSFDKRYNSKTRKRYFEDQSEIYNKNKSIPASKYFAKKDTDPKQKD